MLNGITLLKNATSASATGGTSMSLTEDGTEIKNGIHVADASETDFTIRTNATFTNRNPRLLTDGSYSKGRRSFKLVAPKTLSDGTTVFNLVRIDLEIHPKSTVAEVSNLALLGAQLLCDADTADFISVGSIS